MRKVYPRTLTRVVVLACCVAAALPLVAQTRLAEESRREAWQKVDQIFSAMGVRSGATVADIGAGDGFFTSRLARAVGPDGRVFAVDVNEGALTRRARVARRDPEVEGGRPADRRFRRQRGVTGAKPFG